MKVSTLSNIIFDAAQEAVISKLSAGQVSPEVGVHSGTLALSVDYSFNKLADEEYVPTVSVPYKAVLGLLLTRCPDLTEDLQEALNEALTLKARAAAGIKTAKATLKELTDECPEPNADVGAFLAELPKSVRKGKIINLETKITPLDPSIVLEVVEAQRAAERAKLIEELEAMERAQAEIVAKLESLS